MSPPPVSRAVRIGHVLATLLLVLSVVFGAAALISAAVGVARHGDSPLYGEPLKVQAQISPDDLRRLPPGVHPRGWTGVDVDVPHPTTGDMLLRTALDLAPLPLIVAGVWLVRGFLTSVMAGDPFGARNVGRLRTLGGLLLAGGLVVALVQSGLRQALFDRLPPHPALHLGVQGFEWPGSVLLAGLGALILAEVFAYGMRLREDVEATI